MIGVLAGAMGLLDQGSVAQFKIPQDDLWAWFRAGENQTQSAGRLATVESKSSGISATPIAGAGPFVDGLINGRAAWRYSGGETLNTNTGVSLNDWSIYLVARADASDRYERILDHDFRVGFWWGRPDVPASQLGGGVRETVTPYGRFVTVQDGAAHVLGNFRTGGVHSLWVNGVQSASGNVSAALTVGNRIGIGCWHNDENKADRLNGGVIGDVLVYRAAHDTTTRQKISAALMSHWGINP